MTANYHTHTARCHHASGTEREYIETAIARGLKVLGFSDHCPQIFPVDDYYSYFRMRPEETDGYINTLRDLRAEYKNDIDLKIGFEVEYYPEMFDKFIEFAKPYEIDYIILGQHFLRNEYDTSEHSTGMNHSPEQLTLRPLRIFTVPKCAAFVREQKLTVYLSKSIFSEFLKTATIQVNVFSELRARLDATLFSAVMLTIPMP